MLLFTITGDGIDPRLTFCFFRSATGDAETELGGFLTLFRERLELFLLVNKVKSIARQNSAGPKTHPCLTPEIVANDHHIIS